MNLSSPTREDILFGSLFVGFSIISIIPNVLFIMAVYSNKELCKLPSYKNMSILSFLNIGMLVFNLITGIYTMFQTIIHPIMNKLVGAIGMPLYTAYVILSMVLAINCFIQFSFGPGYAQIWFSPKNFRKWYILPTLGFIVVFLFYASPWASIIYFPDQYSWMPDSDLAYSLTANKVEQYIELTGMVITGILYLLKYKFPTTSSSINELRILAQTFIIAIVNIILNFFWYNYGLVFPPIKEAYSFNIFGGIFNCVINPITYIVVNKTIRQSIRTKKSRPNVQKVKPFLENQIRSTNSRPINKH